MAGVNQWTGAAMSISTQVTTAKTWLGGFVLQTKGTSTPGRIVCIDGAAGSGTARLSYGKVRSGTADAGKVGTVGDSEFVSIKRPILFSSGLYVTVGSGGLGSCIATAIYKLA